MYVLKSLISFQQRDDGRKDKTAYSLTLLVSIECFLVLQSRSLSSIDGDNYNEYVRILSTGVTGHWQKLKEKVVTIENLESNITCVHPRYARMKWGCYMCAFRSHEASTIYEYDPFIFTNSSLAHGSYCQYGKPISPFSMHKIRREVGFLSLYQLVTA